MFDPALRTAVLCGLPTGTPDLTQLAQLVRPIVRPLACFGSGIILLVGSFFVSLWQIDGRNAAPGLPDLLPENETAATRTTANQSELWRLTRALGLRISGRMRGNVDAISRIDDQEVTISGWLADPDGDDTPLRLVVFVSGALAASAQTSGERTDVTRAMGLGFGTQKNVAFRVKFRCPIGKQLVVVGLGNKQYLPLDSGVCP